VSAESPSKALTLLANFVIDVVIVLSPHDDVACNRRPAAFEHNLPIGRVNRPGELEPWPLNGAASNGCPCREQGSSRLARTEPSRATIDFGVSPLNRDCSTRSISRSVLFLRFADRIIAAEFEPFTRGAAGGGDVGGIVTLKGFGGGDGCGDAGGELGVPAQVGLVVLISP